MNIDSILLDIIPAINRGNRNLLRLKSISDDELALAEALDVITSLYKKRMQMPTSVIRSKYNEFLDSSIKKRDEPAKLNLVTRSMAQAEPKAPKVRKAKKIKTQIEYGTFGEWDYPNTEWKRKPTLDDIPEIMNQKQQRDPKNSLWNSHEAMVKWFETKGWVNKIPDKYD